MASRKFRIKIDGKIFEAEVEEIGEEKAAAAAPQATQAQNAQTVSTILAAGNAVVAPMPGKIISIKVKKGQNVKNGEVVIILEAMKMEQEIKTALSGTVQEICVTEGETVRKGQELILVS